MRVKEERKGNPPHPAPAEGGAGSKRIVLGCDPGAGCSAAMVRVLVCAYTVASSRKGAPVPRSGAPLPQLGERGFLRLIPAATGKSSLAPCQRGEGWGEGN